MVSLLFQNALLNSIRKARWSSNVNRVAIIHQFNGCQILQQLNKLSF